MKLIPGQTVPGATLTCKNPLFGCNIKFTESFIIIIERIIIVRRTPLYHVHDSPVKILLDFFVICTRDRKNKKKER